ncbi:MAG: response regulator [Betaproteobacteria bacterium]|jgi:two-component system sensor histidine kinase UhpB|nr:response regulator [Betaproteobacteria bacterium]
MAQGLRLLLVEDSQDDAELLLLMLKRGGYDVTHARVGTAAEMQSALDAGNWDLVIADHSLPQFSGIAALNLMKSRGLDTPFIIVSGHIGEDDAVAAMRRGAHDYVMKHNLSRLLPAIDRELREAAIRTARGAAEKRLREQEVRLSAILSNTPGVIFQLQLDRSGRLGFSYVSEGSEELLGLPPSLLIRDAEVLLQRIAEEDRAAFVQCLASAASNTSGATWEGRVCHSVDSWRWISLRLSSTPAEDGHVRGEGVITSIHEIKLAEQELRHSRRRLSELTSHLERVKEQERARIAREIHDDLGGNLTAIKIDLMWLSSRLGNQDGISGKISQIDALIDETIRTTSRIARDLRPGVLDLGLGAAVEWLAREFENRMSIPCRVTVTPDDPEVPADIAAALFSICREALTNISKHAAAGRVVIDIGARRDVVVLKISDNGRGIAAADFAKPGSFGLRGMTERAEQLGGTLEVLSDAASGTTLNLRVPLGEGNAVAASSPGTSEAA